MAYWQLENDHATYAVDWDIVNRLIRSYHRAVLRDVYSHVVTTSGATWNPFSWSLPDLRSLEVDWGQVRSRVNVAADTDFNRLAERATRDVREMHRELSWMVGETGRRTAAFTDRLAAIQTENMGRISRATEGYGTQIEMAKFVRDTAADGLMVGASITTGGAGLGLLGGGSALKGWAKFQDTDNAGAAVLTGVGSFTFGAFKLGGAQVRAGEEAVITILQAQWETGIALAEGKSMGDALALGSLKLAGPFVDRFFKLSAVKGLLERACVPLVVTVTKSSAVENVASSVVGKWAGKVVQKQLVEREGKAGIKAAKEWFSTRGSVPGAPQPPRSEVIQTATLTSELLLTLAIVNMKKGIGHGL